MSKKEIIWREILYQSIEHKNRQFTQKGLADIDTKISVLQDTEVSNRWMSAKGTVDFANNGWGPHDFFQIVFLLNLRIKSLLP